MLNRIRLETVAAMVFVAMLVAFGRDLTAGVVPLPVQWEWTRTVLVAGVGALAAGLTGQALKGKTGVVAPEAD